MSSCRVCGGANAGDARYCSRCGVLLADISPARVSARKVVSVLFSDVRGFTELGEHLDPESLHELVGRWFYEAHHVIARHGGTVEKYMGDAVMAVFGVPAVHEDDALRAARAALEMRTTLAALNDELVQRWGVQLEVRTGVNTGEVVVGETPGGAATTLGDTVNVAQRLEAAAPPGQVLIGEETARLVRAHARLAPMDMLTLKGKAAPVATWRLVSVSSGTVPTPDRAMTPFVGREAERGLLRQTFDEVVATRAPRLVTVLGPAGIGKSRLVRTIRDDLRDEATTVAGRCLPYGEGVAYWPVAEIARRLAGDATEEALAGAAAIGLPGDESELIASRVARAAGFVPGGVTAEEARWGVRKLLEAVASQGPLVVVVEDIHWAESTLLDLLEHLATFASRVPLLFVCLARPELLDERPRWAGVGGERHRLIPLQALTPVEARALLERTDRPAGLTAEERNRLLAAAEGNPLFLQQMVAMRVESGTYSDAIPPTVQAVLTARIDGLTADERAVIQRASIEGRTFHRGALAELMLGEGLDELDASLAALVRRELIHPGRPDFEGEEAYRFNHILIRDTAYDGTPKQVRADLHERHAGWLDRRGGRDAGDHAELSGYHLEQALRCHLEVEPAAEERYRALAARAGDRLGSAGRAALARDDLPAAISLLERATALMHSGAEARTGLLPELGAALADSGRLPDAEAVLEAAVAEAATNGDVTGEGHAQVAHLFVRLQIDTEAGAREARERFDSLLATFTAAGDDLGLSRLWRLRALVHWIGARSTEADAAWLRAAERAERAGDERGWSNALSWLASSALVGPMPVTEAIARCESIRARLGGHRREQAMVLDHLAGLEAMRGEFAAAGRLLADRDAVMADLGVTMHTAVSHDEALVALLSGDAAGAEAVLRAGYDRLSEMGEKALLASTAAMLAQSILEQGRPEEALELTRVAAEMAAGDDLSAQIAWRGVRARILARRGETAAAKRLSAEAVELAERTDWLSEHADALLARAEVQRLAGEPMTAADAIRNAIALYERKGNTIGANHARSMAAAEALTSAGSHETRR